MTCQNVATTYVIKTCVSIDGSYDFGDQVRDRAPFFLDCLRGDIAVALMRWISSFSRQYPLGLGHCKLALGTNSYCEALLWVSELALETEDETLIYSQI
jgi:hypothetical protein